LLKESKKKICVTCTAECMYSIGALNDRKTRPTQISIRTELVLHGHPSTRPIQDVGRKRQANTQEQCNELIDHYRFSHPNTL
jgi:hypothetical protein